MTPELRDYVLSLPLDVRRELAKCYGPWWHLVGSLATALSADSGRDDPLEDLVTVTGSHRRACLPVSPIAIALHAAKLAGMDRGEWSGSELSGHSRCAVSSPVDPYSDANDIVAFGGGTDGTRDPTGHRAAIALLQKVMEAKDRES